MESTNQNLVNPTKIISIDLSCPPNVDKRPETVKLTMSEYKLIKIKDPTCLYIISDSPNKLVYCGDMLVKQESLNRTYLLGPGKRHGEYILYINDIYNNHDNIIPLCTYTDIQAAINDLNRFNHVGSTNRLNLQIATIIHQYLSEDISLNDMIIGIIARFGYQNDIRLQGLLAAIRSYPVEGSSHYLPESLARNLDVFKNYRQNHLFRCYATLYDLVVAYHYFTDKEFIKEDPDEINLESVVKKIFDIMTSAI